MLKQEKRKVAFIALGCPKNDIDGEIMLGLLKERGYDLTIDAADADAIIVNTCAFIRSAQEEAIDAVLTAALHKKTGKLRQLVVSGCLAERYKEKMIDLFPEVDAVIGLGSIGETADILDGLFNGRNSHKVFCSGSLSMDYLENSRILSESRPFQYLKIAEGCDNRCTYCVIPSLRGKYQSRTLEALFKEAANLVSQGAKELVLVAQDVTRYGTDLYGKRSLVELIKRLSSIDHLSRIRLLYCYPDQIDDALILELQTNPKLMKYLDIPIQHISDSVLHKMGRKGDSSDIINLLDKLRKEIPDIVIRTSLITGFPGETEEDFQKLKQFIKEAPFEHLGVFDYSKETGTLAGKMKDQVPVRIRKKRRDEIMAVQQENVKNHNLSRIGKTYDTIIESVSEDGIFYTGRTYAEAPDIDPVVYITSENPVDPGEIVSVQILCVNEYDLIGNVIVK